MGEEYLVRLEHIEKIFFGVKVLEDVELKVKYGEVHALLGENGAGKSTLMKILTGIYRRDAGSIFVGGKEVNIRNPDDARNCGITIMHQEICLVPQLTIYENVYLGREIKNAYGMIDKAAMKKHVQQVLDDLGLELKATNTVGNLSIAQQQMVEIVKALAFNSKLIVMDEPTASLTEREVESLLEEIRKLKARGISIVYISHRMPEIFAVCDCATILRDGKFIGRVEMADVEIRDLIRMMVGREIGDVFGVEHRACGRENIVLEARHLKNRYLKDISFQLKEGEILGFSGLVGAGRSELSRAIYGIDKLDEGEILLNGKPVVIHTPDQALSQGIALVPEDRKDCGLVQSNTVAFNLTLPVVKQFIKGLRVDKKKEQEIVDEYAYKLSIKMNSPKQLCQSLSGGNQQKVVLSKCLVSNPSIIILDEPTRGIDVGTKSEIYHLIQDLAQQGISVIFISSELPEIVNLSSRIVVMHEGSLVKVFSEEETANITQETIMYYATGGQ